MRSFAITSLKTCKNKHNKPNRHSFAITSLETRKNEHIGPNIRSFAITLLEMCKTEQNGPNMHSFAITSLETRKNKHNGPNMRSFAIYNLWTRKKMSTFTVTHFACWATRLASSNTPQRVNLHRLVEGRKGGHLPPWWCWKHFLADSMNGTHEAGLRDQFPVKLL